MSIGLFSTPPRKHTPTAHPTDPELRAALRKEVDDIREAGTVTAVPLEELALACPLFVIRKPHQPGKFRVIHDLRRLNRHIRYRRFRLEGLRTAIPLLRKGDWMTSLDLKSAYTHVAIRERERKWVGFIYDGVAYRYNALPFGLSSAPRLFTKMLRPAVRRLREEGHRVVLYLDDMLVLGRSPALARAAWTRATELLQQLGLTLSLPKCQSTPVQRLQFLGVEIDTVRQRLYLPRDKVRLLVRDARRLARAPTTTLRQAAAFVGRANFAASCLRVGRLHVHPLASWVAAGVRQRQDWGSTVPVPTAVQALHSEGQPFISTRGDTSFVPHHPRTGAAQ